MKRFYARVEVVEDETDCFAIQLDGRTVKTPAKATLSVPTRKLAERISVEWAAQRDEIDPASMPMTGLSNAAIDRVSPNRDLLIDRLAGQIVSDPLRFRAHAPRDLVEREAEAWDPVLGDFRDRFGVTLTTIAGLGMPENVPEAETCVRNFAGARDDFRLTALVDLAQNLGSIVVAIATLEEAIDAERAFGAAFLEELHQAEHWGYDKEAEDRRRSIRTDIETALSFDQLLRQA